ncbi:hypothetical protein ACGFZA_07455 [Streptomyces sp. NPDC048211]|uniref:hypothetical protein n=1 Tax=Streptomyces sp. NPDC048211 TaxID=3365516 RepID=UPI00371B6898
MSAHENAVQSLINGGYGERQAREILSFVRGEAREEGYNRGAAAARAEAIADRDALLAIRTAAQGDDMPRVRRLIADYYADARAEDTVAVTS